MQEGILCMQLKDKMYEIENSRSWKIGCYNKCVVNKIFVWSNIVYIMKYEINFNEKFVVWSIAIF